MADKKEKKTDKKEKKNITEKIIKKIKNYSGSVEDFLWSLKHGTSSSGSVGKPKKWGVEAEEKSSGGLIKGKPKLAKRGWK